MVEVVIGWDRTNVQLIVQFLLHLDSLHQRLQIDTLSEKPIPTLLHLFLMPRIIILILLLQNDVQLFQSLGSYSGHLVPERMNFFYHSWLVVHLVDLLSDLCHGHQSLADYLIFIIVDLYISHQHSYQGESGDENEYFHKSTWICLRFILHTIFASFLELYLKRILFWNMQKEKIISNFFQKYLHFDV